MTLNLQEFPNFQAGTYRIWIQNKKGYKIISLTACLINDLEYDLESPKLYYKWIFQSKSHEKGVLLHAFLALLVKKGIFS